MFDLLSYISNLKFDLPSYIDWLIENFPGGPLNISRVDSTPCYSITLWAGDSIVGKAIDLPVLKYVVEEYNTKAKKNI